MIRLRILGSIELADSSGRELTAVLAQPRRFALLGYVAAADGGFVRRDALLAMFWPELDDAHARSALNQAVRFLRKSLGSTSVLVSRGVEDLAVAPSYLWCDLSAFRGAVEAGRLAEALELYRDDLLPGFHCDGAPGFDEWLERERQRLRADAARAAKKLASRSEQAEAFTTAVSTARRAVELSATDERSVRELLALLDRLGDRAGAIHAYEAFARRLAEELEATPAPETVALIEAIRTRSTPDERSPVPRPPPTAHTERRTRADVHERALIGTELNGWLIERELARGGMSTVYLARDAKHDRHVAVKVLRSDLAPAVGAEWFLREVRITARLAHPHILPLIDSGASRDALYLVTPYVPGESLRDQLAREKRLSVDAALAIATEVAEALDYAHRNGVIHCDIKPDNVLLADGHAVVADFGVATALFASSTITGTEVRGSPPYMSPEQEAGAIVTHASDIYSLGGVLFEMITGSLPRSDVSARDVLALRRDAPPAVAALVAECLTSIPERRLPSASALLRRIEAVDLEPEAGHPSRDRRGSRATRIRALAATAATAATIILMMLALRRALRSPALPAVMMSDSTVAIAPFDVFGAGEHAFWGEGLVDVLAGNLDGAGPIRTVSSSLAIRRWTGRADPASAEDFGRGLRARFVVFGRIMGTGRDSLRVYATLYDVTTRNTIEALDLTTSAQRMDRLADSISVRLLRALSRAGAADPDRPASFGTASGPALKEFLRGEQFYRRAMWDSALAHDMGALAIDSTFPVALSRVHRILAFHRRVGTRPDSAAWEFARRAGRHNHGLTPRESLLVLRDSLVVALNAQENDPQWWTHQRRRLQATEELTRRYPNDPTAWATYGDELSGAEVLGVTEAQALVALDRAIELDSAVTPIYVDAFGLALRTRGADDARRYAEAFLSRTPAGDDTQRLRILTWITAHPGASPKAAGPLVDSASVAALRRAAATLTHWPDSVQSGIWLAREALRRAGPPDSAAAIETLARTLASRGHTREAFEVDPTEDEWAFAEYVLGGSLPIDTVRARYARVLRDARPTRPLTPRGSVHRIALMVPFAWWTAHGDTASLQRSLSLASRFSQHSGAPFGAGVWRYVAATADAYLALARGDTASSLRRFLALPDTLCPWCKYERLQTAELLAATGRWQDAYSFTRRGLRPSVEFAGVSQVAWTLIAARAAEAIGRRDEARRDYRFVADTWRFADARLRRVAAEARLAARRLGGS